MPNKLIAPRGTQDILPPISFLWQEIEAKAIELFSASGFEEIRTPIFEATELFDRAVGEDSDIVNKEMYTFQDRSERSLTLRPEATAGVVRAFIEHSLDKQGKPQKLWYRGPMFRYERPQTGRYRQFHQIGIEALGLKAPYIDIEVLSLGVKLLENLGLKDLTVHINSIGNETSRKDYSEALQSFLCGVIDEVCDDCKRRFEQNPLRCLDCKVPADQELYKHAPLIHDYLDEESYKIWSEIQSALKKLGIHYHIDQKLVRGLDYYSHLVFEIKTNSDELGTQSTVLGGGRYDSLVEQLGGPSTPAVGFALGIERIAQLLKNQSTNKQNSAYIISDNPLEAQILANKLRVETAYKLKIDFDYENSKFKKQLERALKKSYTWAIFYLGEERESGKFKIKNLIESKEYEALSYKEVLDLLEAKVYN